MSFVKILANASNTLEFNPCELLCKQTGPKKIRTYFETGFVQMIELKKFGVI